VTQTSSPAILELAASYERHADQAHSMWYRGDLFTFLAEGRDTGGQFTIIQFAPKRGLEPPPHTHTNEDEAYYVLAGELTFRVGEQEIEAQAGSFIFLPRGVQHVWRIHTPEARLLMMFTPAGLENFFKQLADPVVGDDLHNAPQTRPDMARMRTLADQYGLIFPAPKS
jgi:quercetin dioxygenase-like cupin family protein